MSLFLCLDTMEKALLMVIGAALLVWAWSIFNWVWLRPKKLEKHLRKQGLSGNSYRFWYGDAKELFQTKSQNKPTYMNFSHDIGPHLMPFVHNSIMTHGKKSFVWRGPIPRVNIMEPELIKEIWNNYTVFRKAQLSPLTKLFVIGVGALDDEKWVKHRRLLNPAFYIEKLKNMVPAFCLTCEEMLIKWEKIGTEGSGEVDVWPHLITFTSDVISRTAFGSSYEEGRRIFQLQAEQLEHTMQAVRSNYIPGWRFVPTKRHKRMKEIYNEVNSLVTAIINRRMEEIKAGKNENDDLLRMLLESNVREIESHGDDQKAGLTTQEVIEECKTFYFAGADTTSNLLVWTMILLARHQEWQQRAREEVFQVFGNGEPDFDGLNRLKIVTMILNEVLRLYPPVPSITRAVTKDTELGGMFLPAGMLVFMPTILVHHDPEIWGSDSKEFNPERFAEGVSKAAKNPAAFFPFGAGPKFCIGQNFALFEAKVAISMILRRFSFELSPSYTHSPFTILLLQPRHGAHLILRKLQGNA